MTGFWLLLYLVWSPLLGLPYPPPLLGAQAAVAGVTAVVTAIWFQFPFTWRVDPAFRRRTKFLLVAQELSIFKRPVTTYNISSVCIHCINI